MTTTAAPATFPCPRCGHVLFTGQLVCPQCNGLVYAQRSNELATEAQREEPTNPVAAALVWQQTLPLLPPDSDQYRMVAQRIGALTAGIGTTPGRDGQPPTHQPAAPRNDPLSLAIAKTIGSMLLSIVVYTWLFSENGLAFGAMFATGFTILILIHELGHVAAMKYYGLSASPPIFIPFLGALINLRQRRATHWKKRSSASAGRSPERSLPSPPSRWPCISTAGCSSNSRRSDFY